MHPSRHARTLVVCAALVLPAGAVAGGTDTDETPIVVRVDRGGFSWTDAAVGAAAGVGATLATAGGFALLRPRRSLTHSVSRREEP
jgi:hypothetical protein